MTLFASLRQVEAEGLADEEAGDYPSERPTSETTRQEA